MYAYLFLLCFTFFNFAYSLDPAWNNLKQYGCLVVIPDGEAGFVCAPQEFQDAENRRLRFQNKKNECDSYGKNTVEISDGEFDCENAEMSSSTNFNGEYGGRKRRSSFQMDPYENKADADPRVVVGDDIEISGSQNSYSQCPGTSTDSLSCFLTSAGNDGYVSAGQLLDLVDSSFPSYSSTRKAQLKSQLEAIDYMERFGGDISSSLQDQSFVSEMSQCEKDKQSAKTCCSNGEACLTGSQKSTGFMNQFFGAASATAMNSQMGAYEACNTMQKLSVGGSAATLALNTMCKNEVNNCSQSCGNVYKISKQLDADLNYKTANGDSVCETLSKVRGALAEHFDVESFKQTCNQGLQTVASTQTMNSAVCQDFEQSNWQQASLALQQLAQSEIAARNCKVLVKGQNVATTGASVPFNGNCADAAHYYDAVCVQCRADSKLPQCAGLTGIPNVHRTDRNLSSNVVYRPQENAPTDSTFGLSAPIDFENQDSPDTDDPKQIAASSNLGLVQGGGGQGASGGPGVGGMNDSGGVSNPNQSSGALSSKYGTLNTNLLQGFRSGGGFKSYYGGQIGDNAINKTRRMVANVFNRLQKFKGDKKDFPYRKYLPPGSRYAVTDLSDKRSVIIDQVSQHGGLDDINREVAAIEERQLEYGYRFMQWVGLSLGVTGPTALSFSEWLEDLYNREYYYRGDLRKGYAIASEWFLYIFAVACFFIGLIYFIKSHRDEKRAILAFCEQQKQLKQKKSFDQNDDWDAKTVV